MSFSKIGTIAVHEYVVNVRRIGFIFVTLLFPALGFLGIIVAGFFSGQATNFLKTQLTPEVTKTGVIDESKLFTPIAPQFANRYVAFPDDATAKQALLAGQVVAYIVIPSDYLSTGKVTVYSEGGFSGVAAADESTGLRTFLVRGILAGKVDSIYITRASNPADTTLVTLDSKGNPTKEGGLAIVSGFIAPYIFSLLLFISVFASSSYLLRSVADEKETRVIEIVLSSVSPTELLAGKVIGLGALGLTQVGVWLLSSFVLSSGLGALVAGAVLVLNPGSFFLAVLYFFLGYLLFGTLMATAGSLGTSPRESQQVAGIFSFMAAMPWFFAGILFTNPNTLIARILSYFPLTAPTTMMLRLPLGEVPVVDIVVSIAVLLVSIPVALWAGARLFRMGLLMYGKRPGLAEIVRALRTA